MKIFKVFFYGTDWTGIANSRENAIEIARAGSLFVKVKTVRFCTPRERKSFLKAEIGGLDFKEENLYAQLKQVIQQRYVLEKELRRK